jgi:hypothetical protein
MSSVRQQQSDIFGDFMKGALKGMLITGALMGVMTLVFMGIGAALPLLNITGIAAPHLSLFGASHLASSIGIILTSGIVNGGLRAYQGTRVDHHMRQGNTREAHVTRSSPTLVPIPGFEHGTTLDAVEMEHSHQPTRNWRASVGGRGGDRVQEILRNGSMSDHDRAAAILAEREARAANPQNRTV